MFNITVFPRRQSRGVAFFDSTRDPGQFFSLPDCRDSVRIPPGFPTGYDREPITLRSAGHSMPLLKALRRKWHGIDAQAVSYCVPGNWPEPFRVTRAALVSLPEAWCPIHSAVFVDCDWPLKEEYRRETSLPPTIERLNTIEALRRDRAEFVATQLKVVLSLPEGRCAAWYETPGGVRFAWRAKPTIITFDNQHELEARIRGFFDRLAAAGANPDYSTSDWTHFARLPFVVRDGVPLNLPADFSGLETGETIDVWDYDPDYASPVQVSQLPKPEDAASPGQAASRRRRINARQRGPAHGAPMPSASSEAVERAIRYASAVPGAVQGSRGDEHTWALIYTLCEGFGLSADDILNVLYASGWNARCEPPWSEHDLRMKCRRAPYVVDSSRVGRLLTNSSRKRETANRKKMQDLVDFVMVAESRASFDPEGNHHTIIFDRLRKLNRSSHSSHNKERGSFSQCRGFAPAPPTNNGSGQDGAAAAASEDGLTRTVVESVQPKAIVPARGGARGKDWSSRTPMGMPNKANSVDGRKGWSWTPAAPAKDWRDKLSALRDRRRCDADSELAAIVAEDKGDPQDPQDPHVYSVFSQRLPVLSSWAISDRHTEIPNTDAGKELIRCLRDTLEAANQRLDAARRKRLRLAVIDHNGVRPFGHSHRHWCPSAAWVEGSREATELLCTIAALRRKGVNPRIVAGVYEWDGAVDTVLGRTNPFPVLSKALRQIGGSVPYMCLVSRGYGDFWDVEGVKAMRCPTLALWIVTDDTDENALASNLGRASLPGRWRMLEAPRVVTPRIAATWVENAFGCLPEWIVKGSADILVAGYWAFKGLRLKYASKSMSAIWTTFRELAGEPLPANAQTVCSVDLGIDVVVADFRASVGKIPEGPPEGPPEGQPEEPPGGPPGGPGRPPGGPGRPSGGPGCPKGRIPEVPPLTGNVVNSIRSWLAVIDDAPTKWRTPSASICRGLAGYGLGIDVPIEEVTDICRDIVAAFEKNDLRRTHDLIDLLDAVGGKYETMPIRKVG